MFTGIVEGVGILSEVKGTGGGFRVRIQTAQLASSLKIGDSLAVNGVCLTVILIDGDHVLAVDEDHGQADAVDREAVPHLHLRRERRMNADAKAAAGAFHFSE